MDGAHCGILSPQLGILPFGPFKSLGRVSPSKYPNKLKSLIEMCDRLEGDCKELWEFRGRRGSQAFLPQPLI